MVAHFTFRTNDENKVFFRKKYRIWRLLRCNQMPSTNRNAWFTPWMRIVSNIITMGEHLPKYMLFYQMSSGIINTFSSSLIVNFLYYHDEHSCYYDKAICRSILSRSVSLNIVSDVNKFILKLTAVCPRSLVQFSGDITKYFAPMLSVHHPPACILSIQNWPNYV